MGIARGGSVYRWVAAALAGGALQLVPPMPPVLPPPVEDALAPPRPAVHVTTTGNDSELVKTLAVTRRPGTARRVVMSLTPRKLPKLRHGSRLRVTAEVQVSTTCHERTSRCIGRRYHFSPEIVGRLVLARHSRATGGRQLSMTKSVRCSQRRPDRNHHCVIVFDAAGMKVSKQERIPCLPESCFVNLVMGAHHSGARRGNVVVVGGDRPGGRIVQDKGRLNALLIPRKRPSASQTMARRRVARSLPSGVDGEAGKRVVYSVALPGLRKGERLVVTASQITDISGLPYNTFVSSELILAESPRATRPGKAARRVASLRGRLSEANGFNCTRGPSAFKTPCESRKVGVVRIKRSAVDALGRSGELYVNLVSGSSALLRRADGNDRVAIQRGGFLKVIRYARRR